MEVKNISLQQHMRAGLVERCNQGFKVILSPFDQADLVPVTQRWVVPHVQLFQANSATSGKWSDMRCQIRPDGTMACTGVRPRAYTWSSWFSGRREG